MSSKSQRMFPRPALASLVSETPHRPHTSPPILWPMLNITHNAFISFQTPNTRHRAATGGAAGQREWADTREVESESGE